jgi:hypothetical protein
VVSVLPGSPVYFNGGTPTDSLGRLQVVTTGINALGGMTYDNNDRLVVNNGGAIAAYVAGLPVDTVGKLCVAYGGTIVGSASGFPVDAAGRVCLVAPVTLSFKDEMEVVHVLTVGINPAGTRVGYRRGEWGDFQPDDVPRLSRLYSNLNNNRLVVQGDGDLTDATVSGFHTTRLSTGASFNFGAPSSVLFDGVSTEFIWIVPFDFVEGEQYEIHLS